MNGLVGACNLIRKYRSTFNILKSQPMGRRPPGRPRQRFIDNLKRDLQAIEQIEGWEDAPRDRAKCRGFSSSTRAVRPSEVVVVVEI